MRFVQILIDLKKRSVLLLLSYYSLSVTLLGYSLTFQKLLFLFNLFIDSFF